MKKAIIALSVFAFVFTFATTGSDAVAQEANSYAVVSPADQDPPKAEANKATAETKSACCDKTAQAKAASADCNTPCTDKAKSAKASADCNTPCTDKDKSAKASADCDSKKATTTTAAVVEPDVK